MTITLDKITEEMLKAIMAKKNQVDPKKYLSELIKDLYLRM
jgi:hypothetical protein